MNSGIEQLSNEYDIVILGAGPVGSTLALLLAGTQHRILVLEQRSLQDGHKDPRALALSEGARQLLQPLNAWPSTNDQQNLRCTPIKTIHISQHGGFGRTLIDHQDYRVPALGYVVQYGALLESLHSALQQTTQQRPTVSYLEKVQASIVDDITSESESAFWRHIKVGEHTIKTRLIVHAEGTPPDNSTNVITRSYDQCALIFEAGMANPHHQRAWERFTPQGPLALLPIDGPNGKKVSVVYTVPESEVDHILGLNDESLLQRMQSAIGSHAVFTSVGHRSSFPLKLRLRRPVQKNRELWIGNAAQTLHPVSGQGFNLGLRDAAMLAFRLRHALDPGSTHTLLPYVNSRQLDRIGAAVFTDGIVRAFSTSFPILNTARGIGLTALDIFSPLRHFVAKRMIWGARAWP